MFHNRYGLAGLLKEGHRQFTGIDEVTQRNIEAARALSEITRTSLGPNSLSKLMVNSHGKRVITADASVIVRGLEVQHPAAKLVAFAADMQSDEFGGSVNFLLVLAGQLLSQAEYLIKQGLHQTDVIRGYEKALAKVPEYLEECVCHTVTDFKDKEALAKVLKPTVDTKPLCAEGQLHRLVAEASILVAAADPTKSFDVENIRVAKLTGGALSQSVLLKGMVVTRPPSGTITKKENCKVMVLGCGLEATGTEAKGTVLVRNAEELKNFTKGEEKQMEDIIQKIKDAGVEVIIVHGGAISDVAQHYCNKYEILTLKVQSKFETRRLCRALGATAVVRLAVPTAEELGTCVSIAVAEVASKKVTNILTKDTRVCTIVLRGSTPAILEEAERAVDDAANLFKALTRDGRLVAGAGAVDMELARKLQKYGSEIPGVEQYAVMKFGESFEAVPRLLAESSGHSATEVLAALHTAHQQGRAYEGVNSDISLSGSNMNKGGSGEKRSSDSSNAAATKTAGDSATGTQDLNIKGRQVLTVNAQEKGVYDHMLTKQWAIKLATDAAITVLQVDQIIMARPAGGPAPRAPGAPDAD